MKLSVASLAIGAVLLASAPAGAQKDFDGIGHLEGRSDAPIRIIEFADYACAFCAQFSRETMPELRRDWIETGRASFRFIGFHNSYYKPGRDAARAAECAADQDAFHAMHDVIFERQRAWLSRGGQRERFEGWADEIGLDVVAFRQCWQRNPSSDRMDRNSDVARDHGVRATPTFFIGERRIEGALSYDQLREIIETEYMSADRFHDSDSEVSSRSTAPRLPRQSVLR
jgi:protein-disulfide isomerase